MSEETLPGMDDARSDGPTEQELLDAVMANSPIMEDAGIPLPAEEETVEDPVEYDEDVDDPASDEAVSEDYEEEVEELEEEEVSGDDTSTETEVFSQDDLDLDAKVAVKIDGEEMEVSFGDLIKGYSTEQSLSKKGRELGEARKAIEEERTEKLANLDQLMGAANQFLAQGEQALAKQYHDIEKQIQEARDNGDTYELGELKDKREQAQQQYWKARKQRESMLTVAAEQYQKVQADAFQAQVDHFYETVPTLIPDFNEEVATSIRQFAVDEGINPEILDTITDPAIVKFVDDYRRLKQGVSKGKAKRKAAPTKKVPAKKATPPQKKQQDREKMIKARAMREDASNDDHMAFLRQYASKSLNQ